jgi:hypothetical protein
MNGRVNFKEFEKGQVIIIVALGLVALIAMSALIVDGAIIMSHRRTAQAAADAAALAGAELLCPNVYSESDAINVAETYIGLNQAEVVEVSISDEYPNTIHVEATVNSSSFFARILDQTELSANAVAEASCTPLSTGAATLPVVYPCEDKDPLDGVVECHKNYYDDSLTPAQNREARNYTIIHDSTAQLEYCDVVGVNCDDVVASGAKGWVSLTPGGKKQDLEDWVSGSVSTPEISVGFWLPSLNGVDNNDMEMLKDYVDKLFLVPIYNAQYDKIDPRDSTEFVEGFDNVSIIIDYGDNGILDDYDTPYAGLGHDSYRIAGFGLFKMTCVQTKNKDDCPYRKHLFENEGFEDFDTKNSSLITIEGYFLEGTYPTGGGDGVDTGVYTVHLRR